MTRRTALIASFGIVGQILRDSAETNAQTAELRFNIWKPPTDLTITLGAGGYERFHFTRGTEKVTVTADELFNALKGPSETP